MPHFHSRCSHPGCNKEGYATDDTFAYWQCADGHRWADTTSHMDEDDYIPYEPVYPKPETKCGRTACNNRIHLDCRHTDTDVYYCLGCARKINEYSPGIITIPLR